VPARARSWSVILAALVIADVAYGFQQTGISPALPVVQHDLHASREWTAWLYSGYLIVASVTPVFLGKLADRSGKRRIYLLALVVFLAGSVGAAISPNIQLVVLCRVVQGFGGAVFPLSFSIARDLLPAGRVSTGIGILTGAFGLGSLGGYAIGGLIAQFLSWRWVFGFGAIALGAAVVLVRATVPASTEQTERSLDTPGATLFGGAMAALIVAITEGPQSGWASPLVVALFVVSAAALAGWFVRELSTEEPLINPRILGSRPVLFANVSSLLSGFTLFAINLLLPFLLEGSGAGPGLMAFGLAAGPLLTGLVLLPRAFGQAVSGPLTGALARRIGQAPALACGTALMAGGAAGLAGARGQIWMISIELAALGVGFGLVVSVSGTIVTSSVGPTESGIAASFNSVLRRVGGGIGAQVGAALIAVIVIPGTSTPAPTAFTSSFAAAAGVGTLATLAALLVAPRGQRRPSRAAGR
jgi:MFS family permease